MPTLTLRDVPADLHQWLKDLASSHRRSLNQEVIQQLDGLRQGPAPGLRGSTAAERLARIDAITQASARLQILDTRPEAEILGYGPDGLPS